MKSKQIYIGNNIPGAVQRAQNNPTTTLIKLTYRFSFFPLFYFFLSVNSYINVNIKLVNLSGETDKISFQT